VDEGKRASLVDHLDELRGRILRSALYTVAGMALVWAAFPPVYRFLVRPIQAQVDKFGAELDVFHVMEGFLIRMEVALIGGLILAAPFIFREVWAFVAPGLMPNERRTVRPIVPVAAVLFLLGVAMAYAITEPTIYFFLLFVPHGAHARLNLNNTLLLMLKFYLAFGLAFQLPIVLVLLAKLGIVNSRILIRRWREAVVIILVVAAIITPSWDPIIMTVCAIPMVLLYLGTIGVIKVIDRRRARREQAERTLAG